MKLKFSKYASLIGIVILLIRPILAYSGTIEEGLNPSHISFMLALMLILLIVIFLSFKCWKIFEEGACPFSFKFITFGLIILGMNQALTVSSHFGIINFSVSLEHLVNILGYSVLGLGLYFIIKSNSK